MTYKTFGIQISCLAIATALLNLGISPFVDFPKLAWASWLLFLNITVLAFVLGKYSVKMAYKNAFVGVFMGITAFKLLAAPTLVFWYKTHFSPTTYVYIVPFMVFFLIFMAYETYFLELIAKE
jgi:hypothetical protein